MIARKHDEYNGNCRAIYDPDAACSCPYPAPERGPFDGALLVAAVVASWVAVFALYSFVRSFFPG